MSIQLWRILASEKVLSNPFFNVRRDRCVTGKDHVIPDFYVKEGRSIVTIFALTDDNRVIIEEHYRHGIQKVIFDLPAGLVDGNETPEHAARREFLEETGFVPQELIFLGKIAANPGCDESYVHAFFAKGVVSKPSGLARELAEDMDIHFLSLTDVQRKIEEGKIICSLCLSTIFLAFYHLHFFSNPWRA